MITPEQSSMDTWIETKAEQFVLTHCQCTERRNCDLMGLPVAALVREGVIAGLKDAIAAGATGDAIRARIAELETPNENG